MVNHVHYVNMIHTSSSGTQRRQLRRQKRTESLLDAAQSVLLSEGEAGLTMAAVAEQAQVAVGGLYRYFTGKDSILAALQVRAVHAFDEHLQAATLASPDPISAIRACADAWPAFATAEPELFTLLDRSLSDPQPNLDDAAATSVDAALTPVLGRVTALLHQGVASGQLTPGDPTLRTYALWAAVHGATHFRKRERLGGPDALTIQRGLVDALLTGWGYKNQVY